MQPHSDPYQAQSSRQKKLTIGAIVAVALLLLAGVGFSLLSAKGPAHAPVMQVVAKPAPPVLMAKGEQTPPVLPAENGMPREIFDWLEHLRKIDKERDSLTRQQGADMAKQLALAMVTGGLAPEQMAGQDGPDVEHPPLEGFSKSYEKLAIDQKALEDKFNGVPAPPECIAIASAYQAALQETEQMTLETRQSLKSTDLTAAVKIMHTSSKRIDIQTKLAEDQVQIICAKYKMQPWFSLNVDSLSGLSDTVDKLNPLPSGN